MALGRGLFCAGLWRGSGAWISERQVGHGLGGQPIHSGGGLAARGCAHLGGHLVGVELLRGDYLVETGDPFGVLKLIYPAARQRALWWFLKHPGVPPPGGNPGAHGRGMGVLFSCISCDKSYFSPGTAMWAVPGRVRVKVWTGSSYAGQFSGACPSRN